MKLEEKLFEQYKSNPRKLLMEKPILYFSFIDEYMWDVEQCRVVHHKREDFPMNEYNSWLKYISE